ncbi:unnamed protein product, partial [Mesorhabditis belari]|uniref:Protein kinase domain-containing protein n=1 Tax=Mesorhabditis belari TaxID=2138241 RepID=A0AAF3J7E4_9BILA
MTNLLPDDSYCTSEMGKLMFRSKADCPCTVTLISASDETMIGVTFTAYTLEFKFLPKESLLSEPRIFRLTTRYREVNKLQSALAKLHKQLYLRGTFPTFPQPKLFGKADEAAIEERKRATAHVFEFLLDSEVLRKARLLHEFVQKATETVTSPNIVTLTSLPTRVNDVQLQDIMDTPIPTSTANDLNTLLEPTTEATSEEQAQEHTLDASQSISGETESQAYNTPPDSPSAFQFPDLPLTFDSSTERDHPPTAIRRFLNKMPLAAPFSSRVLTETVKSDEYLLVAAELVSTAQRAESEREFELAFHCLKQAAHVLIQGLQEEKDVTLRNAVRRKTAKYLVRAERIYRSHLSYDGTQLNFEELYAASIKDPNIMAFQCSNAQLKSYKIVGISPEVEAERRVFVVEEQGTGFRYAMKLLEKGEESDDAHRFLPTNIPHMTEMHKFFQTQNFIILLITFVETGQLWSFLSSYFEICAKNLQDEIMKDAELDANSNWKGRSDENDYQGRHLSFSVGIDTDRLSRMTQRELDETSDENQSTSATSELCTIGVEAISEEENLKQDIKEILVFGPSEDEDIPFRAEEEAPAPLRLAKDLGSSRNVMSGLCSALSNCSELLSSRQLWDSQRDLPECLIIHWTAQLVSALYVLHTHGEFICDLQPSNLLIGSDGNLILTSHAVWNGRKHGEISFRKGYAAPECFRYPFELTTECDIWSLGAILYELTTGIPLAIAAPHGVGKPGLDPPFPKFCTTSLFARDLINRILVEDPNERLTLDAIRAHPFFQSINWNLYDNPHSTRIIKETTSPRAISNKIDYSNDLPTSSQSQIDV